jgi:bile acid:Na+ symporter, BASS family
MPILQPFFRFAKDWSMPLAMIGGIVFHRLLNNLSFLIPYLIFFMLLLTFTRLTPSKLKFSRMHAWLLTIQIVGSIGVYFMLLPVDKLLADSALICFIGPTATSAAVVTGLLGGSVASLTTYTLLSNLMVSVVGPLIFTLLGPDKDISFIASFLEIFYKVAPMLLLPLVVAWILQRFAPKANEAMIKLKAWPFYIWILALGIVTARTVCFLIDQEKPDIVLEVSIALISLVICALQFILGKRIGAIYGKRISGGQALGQKNTILAIWMAQTFLSPVASLGPAAYVLWQNAFNSWQLYRRRNSSEKGTEED